jgi:hypothetical protein
MQTQNSGKFQAMQANNVRTESAAPAWQYDQEVKQARKASKGLRMQRKTRKGFWQSGE